MTDRTTVTRRRLITTGALAAAVGVAGCSGSGDGGGASGGGDDSDSDNDSGSDGPSYDGWLDDVGNFDGSVVDRTGDETVAVTVGAGNGLLFDPPAVRISPGTTVRWTWTGRGGQHNVKGDNRDFESPLDSQEGTTFEYVFDAPGAVRYLCVPHQAVGMKGVVDVVDD